MATSTHIITTSGVQVVVRPTSSPAPVAREEPPPFERGPRMVVRPPPNPHAARDAAVRRIFERDGVFLLKLLSRARGVNPASAEELAQEVLIVLTEYLETHEEPLENDRAYLTTVARGFLGNRRRVGRLDVDPGADTADAADPVPDPELLVYLVQRGKALHTAIEALPALLRPVVRCVDLDELTVDEAAAKLGRPLGTVSTQLRRGRALLGKLLRASERGRP